jgi:hypothetical protein
MIRRSILMLVVAGIATGCEDNKAPDDQATRPQENEVTRVSTAPEAIAGVDLATLDPQTMSEPEVRKLIGNGPRCEFRYTTAGSGVVGIKMPPEIGGSKGVVKLNGSLISLTSETSAKASETERTIMLAAEPIRIKIVSDRGTGWVPVPHVERREANMMFEVADSLKVGYRGYIDCSSKPIDIEHRRS